MGCGLISQRGTGAAGVSASTSAVGGASGSSVAGETGPQRPSRERPRPRGHHRDLDPGRGERERGSGADDEDEVGVEPRRRSHSDGIDERPSRAHRGHHGGEEGFGRGGRVLGRRFIVGERIVLSSRLPGNAQDHAFCFECGACFQLGTARTPQCSRCGSSFVQYLRSAGSENWITAESASAQGYAFDDQLDNSITASLDEAPLQKRPTQGAFLRSLPALRLTQEEVEARSKLEAADPRKSCSICREAFAVSDTLRKCPCSHEFHDGCIVPWLQSNNTCPICRCKMPEASESEDEDGDGVFDRKKRRQQRQQANHPDEEAQPEGGASRLGAARDRGGPEDGSGFLDEQQDVVASEGLGASSPPPASSGITATGTFATPASIPQ